MVLTNDPCRPLTLILLSWKRPNNVRHIVRIYCSFRRIGEIILWNNNPNYKIGLRNHKIKYFQSDNHYTISRYAATFFSSNNSILFHDDDLLLTEEQIERLFEAHLAHPQSIVGCFGRNLKNGKYVKKYAYGKVDIILGRIMLFHKTLVSNFIKNCPPYSGAVEDDILFSLSQRRKHISVCIGALQELPKHHALAARVYHGKRRQEMIEYCLNHE